MCCELEQRGSGEGGGGGGGGDYLKHGNEISGSIKCWNLLSGWETVSFLRRTLFHNVNYWLIRNNLKVHRK